MNTVRSPRGQIACMVGVAAFLALVVGNESFAGRGTKVKPAGEAVIVLHVDDDAVDSEEATGLDWGNALNDLQDALALAKLYRDTIEGVTVEIRVAAGEYNLGGQARQTSFEMMSGVAILGGYAGVGALDPDKRDIEQHVTILSGRREGDVPVCTVLTAFECDETAVLDGVTVTRGYPTITCDEWNPKYCGCTTFASGLHIGLGSAPTIRNTVFGVIPPSTWQLGSAVYCGGPARFEDCRFLDIRAPQGYGSNAHYERSSGGDGGAIQFYLVGSQAPAVMDRCVFLRNRAGNGVHPDCYFMNYFPLDGTNGGDGGAIFGTGPVIIKNSVVAFNRSGIALGSNYVLCTLDDICGACCRSDCLPGSEAWECLEQENCIAYGGRGGDGGGVYGSNIELINATIVGNESFEGYLGGGMYGSVSPDVSVSDCIMWDNHAEGGEDGNDDTDPLFVDLPNGDLRLQPESSRINTGNPYYIPESGETDAAGHPRVLCGRIDQGAYEFTDCSIFLPDWPDCMLGPDANAPSAECAALETNGDDIVDLSDFARFQATYAR
jgi:hypothetical protein